MIRLLPTISTLTTYTSKVISNYGSLLT